MGCIYFIRHGQTVWNVENKICGATDIDLTDLGHKQAVITGQAILKQKIDADKILYSPLKRARDTALHISEITGISAEVENRLIEQNFGKYESTARDGLEFRAAKREFANHYEGGESMLRLAQRVYNLLDELKQSDKTYILVAHNGIARMVQSYFYDMTNDEYAAFGIDNCKIVKYEWSDTIRKYRFWGWQHADVSPVTDKYPFIKTVQNLYDVLSDLWCADTCAPRMRHDWTEDNKTLGQCSITAFLAQDIFGGRVYGIERSGGNYHCFNVVDNTKFDLTSEQFGDEELDYNKCVEQFREVHFAKDEKRQRYEYLKQMLDEYRR